MDTEVSQRAEQLVQLWMRLEHLAGLGEDILRVAAFKLAGGTVEELIAEQVLFKPKDVASGAWVVLEGTLFEWCEDVRFSARESGAFVGLVSMAASLSALDPDATPVRLTEMQALSPVKLLRLDPRVIRDEVGTAGPVAQVLASAITQHVREQAVSVSSAVRGLNWQVFGARTSMLPPSPWTAEVRAYLIPVKLPPNLQDSLPPRVTLDPSRRAQLLVAFLDHLGPKHWPTVGRTERDSGNLHSSEVELLVPVKCGGVETMFSVMSFPSTLTSLFLGREIYGQPKMYGSTYEQDLRDKLPDEDPNDVRLVMRTAGQVGMRLRLRFADDEALDLAALLHLMAGILPSNRSGPLEPLEGAPLQERVDICQQRLRRWRLLGRPSDYDFREPDDPTDERYWVHYLQGRMMADAATLQAGETFAAVLERVVRSLRESVPFLPAHMRVVPIASWRRTYATTAKTVCGSQPWHPPDFKVDAITQSHRRLEMIHQLRMFTLDRRELQLKAGDQTYNLQVERASDESPAYGLQLTFTTDFLGQGHRREDALVNYLALADALTTDEKGRLAWGPEVWDPTLLCTPMPLDAPLPPVPPPDEPDALPPAKPNPMLQEALRTVAGPDVWWDAGTELFHAGELGEHCWLIEEGVVEEWRDSTHLGYRRAGELVGEVTVLALSQQRAWQARTVTGCRLSRIEGDHLRALALREDKPVGPLLLSASVRHASTGARKATWNYQQMVYQFFPGNAGRTSPGPYQADDVELYVIPMMKPPGGPLVESLPPRVTWHPALPYSWMLIARFRDFRPAQLEVSSLEPAVYTETGLMVPVLADGKFKLYYPFIHPSTLMALFLGREVYGFSKSWRYTHFDDENKRLVLRNRGTTEMELFYEDSSWADIGLREALWSMWGVFRAFGGDGERPLMAPTEHNTPVFAAMGPLLDAYYKLIPRMPDAFKTVSVAGWMRVFDAAAKIGRKAQRSGKVQWHPDLFDVDGLGGSKFRINAIHSLQPVRLLNPNRIELKNYDGRPPLVLNPLATHGFRIHMSMTMLGDEMAMDYVKMGRNDELTEEDHGRLNLVSAREV